MLPAFMCGECFHAFHYTPNNDANSRNGGDENASAEDAFIDVDGDGGASEDGVGVGGADTTNTQERRVGLFTAYHYQDRAGLE